MQLPTSPWRHGCADPNMYTLMPRREVPRCTGIRPALPALPAESFTSNTLLGVKLTNSGASPPTVELVASTDASGSVVARGLFVKGASGLIKGAIDSNVRACGAQRTGCCPAQQQQRDVGWCLLAREGDGMVGGKHGLNGTFQVACKSPGHPASRCSMVGRATVIRAASSGPVGADPTIAPSMVQAWLAKPSCPLRPRHRRALCMARQCTSWRSALTLSPR